MSQVGRISHPVACLKSFFRSSAPQLVIDSSVVRRLIKRFDRAAIARGRRERRVLGFSG